MVRIVADRNIPLLEQTFGRHADLLLRSGREIDRRDLAGAHALLVKSITPVTRDLLKGTGIRFVGTATIGFDHLDTEWLDQNGIAWTSAPGCNADAAAQYTLAMILLACERLGRDFRELTAGIIGRGNVGSRVAELLGVLGIDSVANDPPLADRGVHGLVSQEEALAQDLVCLHVPLTREGPHPTRHMINRGSLRHVRDGALLVNTARGDVIEGRSVLAGLRDGQLHAAFDVWPDEPRIDTGLLRASLVATPHVAGYSEQGRQNGALMVFAAFCRWAGLAPDTESLPGRSDLVLDLAGETSPAGAIAQVSHVSEDDRAMRSLDGLDPARRAARFDRLRREYPLRNDFGAWRVTGATPELRNTLSALGFQVG